MSEPSFLDKIRQEFDTDDGVVEYKCDPQFFSRFPNLNDILFATESGGQPREPGKLLIFCDEGKLKVCITMPSEGLCAFLVIDSLDILCPSIEEAARKGNLDWRRDKKSKYRSTPK